jgi:dTDP-glucose pyrophosphorylase
VSTDLAKLTIGPEDIIRQAIRCMDSNGMYIALVVDEDVRRAILAGIALNSPVAVLRDRRGTRYPAPVTAPEGTTLATMEDLMRQQQIRFLPIIDSAGRLTQVVTLAEVSKQQEVPVEAVIMAGGYGSRLRPLTDDVPKPMLRIGEKPLLEHMVTQLRAAGIKSLSVTTHYKKELIIDHFKGGDDFGVAISYVEEDAPLGTAGALSLLKRPNGPLLVINGDILTRVDFGAMLSFHREHHAEMTVGIRQFETIIPFGVVERDGADITRLTEKPVITNFISAGIYLLNPEALELIPQGKSYDMPDLVNQLISTGKRVVGFPIREYWLDIGRIEDYEKAQEEINGADKPFHE